MKIAIVTETFLPSTDGIVTRLTASIEHYLEAGHEVIIIAPDLGVAQFGKARIHGMPTITLPFYRTKRFSLPSRKVGSLLKTYGPDIVHVVNPALLGAAGVYYAKKLGIPLLASYHTNLSQYLDFYGLPFMRGLVWLYLRSLHNRASINLCTSRTVREELITRKFRNVKIWKRGVDGRLFHPDRYDPNMRKRLSQGFADKKILLYVGRLASEKEIEKLRDIFNVSNQFVLVIVGDGPHRSALEEYFSGTDTLFTGFLYGEELAAAFASSDVFVFPSTTETLGLVLLEAMASGLPVVAARSGPTCEQVKHEKTGLLFDPADHDGFIAAVRRFEDKRARDAMSAAAYQESFGKGWKEVAEQALHYYWQTAKKGNNSGS
ncbi:group 1 glycosyl transferase [Niallia circulans]|jgi:glycosyltransferase involved in cell wall biosynthesis|uniref:glycosyltransferase family 4 protein n=1 Tax=Shouchella clausii TaxID=79880 RepID=UPI000BA7D126|nr:glycosyltransferase family 1 protein [Shouchella clausii]PAF14320.1 glycosyl transferase [Shouchella clausii]SPU21411.1 group 1 glycosyl transferase [Niallia circulans]